jgi:hypothetical protein
VWSDTLLQTESSATFGTAAAPVQFTLGTPRGTGALAFGDITQETNLPASGSREQLLVRCADASCKFARELKAGYLLVIDASTAAGFSSRLPVTRVITSIISDTELTVDADFNQGSFLGSDYLNRALPHSGATKGVAGAAIAGSGQWTFVSCPPRVGKRANGAGTIESSWNQGGWSTLSPKLDLVNVSTSAGNLGTASGSATGLQHRIVGRGTRFASQFGSAAGWAVRGSGGYYNQGPYLTVQVRSRARASHRMQPADLRTADQRRLGDAARGGAGHVAVRRIRRHLGELLLGAAAAHHAVAVVHHADTGACAALASHAILLLTRRAAQGTGSIRSYGKRVVSEEWSTIEPWADPRNTSAVLPGAQYSSSGYYGNSRFLTQLRTGFTITACGQTRTVNAIHSDVELTVDRPFSNGNREFFPAVSSTTTASALSVRGLSRTLPLWPRGVTVQVIVTVGGKAAVAKYKYNVWWKTFVRTDDGDGNAIDDRCPVSNATCTAGIAMNATAWKNLEDMQLQQLLGVYIRWDTTVTYTAKDEWRLHVGDIQNCDWLISAEGERYINDDNANPPVCYNHGSCVAISSDAQSDADGAMRPVSAGAGLIKYDSSTGLVTSVAVRALRLD